MHVRDARRVVRGLARDAFDLVDRNEQKLGLCVDERGVGEAIDKTRRGSPADLWNFVQQSATTLVIPTKQ